MGVVNLYRLCKLRTFAFGFIGVAQLEKQWY